MRRALASSSSIASFLVGGNLSAGGVGVGGVASAGASPALVNSNSIRHMNFPGWNTSLSTGDGRSKEQKEKDRKARHLEKLPKAVALHAPQYPFERTVLADHAMQPVVFRDHLDTPSLFHSEPPSNFFVYWNVNDFGRTQYPPVPSKDHREVKPGTVGFSKLRHKAGQYMKKHKIVPNYFSSVKQDVNMSAVFNGSYDVRARADDEGNPIPPPPPVKAMHARNFWFTAHYGNYMDLHEVQQPPAIFLQPSDKDVANDAHYTFVMASPDYPYRTDPDATFLLNYIVANIPAKAVEGMTRFDPRQGTVVVPYCPPLPTEDAGCARQLCMLYRQEGGKIASEDLKAMAADEEKTLLPFAQRSAFRFHDTKSVEGKALRSQFPALVAVEKAMPSTPTTVNFFHTKWDIQVQEYYERVGEAEPAYAQDNYMEGVLTHLAADRNDFRISSRHLPDGSVNNGKNANYYLQYARTQIDAVSNFSMRSRRHLLGDNGREKVIGLKSRGARYL